MAAFVLDRRGTPLRPCTGRRARLLLARERTCELAENPALDAVYVGPVNTGSDWQHPTLTIRLSVRGSYPRTRFKHHGFPRDYLMPRKQGQGYQTGVHSGCVEVRAGGSVNNIQEAVAVVQGISHRYCTLIECGNGYAFSFQPRDSFQQERAREARTSHVELSHPGIHAGFFAQSDEF